MGAKLSRQFFRTLLDKTYLKQKSTYLKEIYLKINRFWIKN
jgi:hypothetical protein